MTFSGKDTTMRHPRALWGVVLQDVLLTYVYCFSVNALLPPPQGPHAPPAYWLTQAWVYGLIAPVAAVAAWRGARQVLDAWAGRARWWRLTVEGAVIGAVVPVPFVWNIIFVSPADIPPVMLQVGAMSAGLGLLLTAVNYPIARDVSLVQWADGRAANQAR